MSSEKPEITEVVNTQMPLGATLGIRMFGDADEVDATIDWAPELCTAGGVLHGGVLMSLADAAGGVCAFLNLPPGAGTATISSSTNFLGAVREGEVTGTSRPLHVGRSVVVVQSELRDGEGKLVAQVMQAQAVLAG